MYTVQFYTLNNAIPINKKCKLHYVNYVLLFVLLFFYGEWLENCHGLKMDF